MPQNNKAHQAVVAMSGGVDSSVAALLLKNAKLNPIGITMRLYDVKSTPDLPKNYQGCCTADDADDARRVCEILDIPHYVMDLRKEFQAYVINYFISEYQLGNTPHPCIACNDKIKFSFLLERARFLNASYVCTGHYARIKSNGRGFSLLKGLDADKDQSYVLYNMGQKELAQSLMPVGFYSKADIRRLAHEAGFPNASKPDSQEICFIPLGDYRAFLKEKVQPKPGLLTDSSGAVLGEHKGIEFYTIGQRRGLGIKSNVPLYVTAINPESGVITLGPEKELFHSELFADKVSWISEKPPETGSEVMIKIRYNSTETPGRLFPTATNTTHVEFYDKQRAITPGQAVVFYRGDELIGGGRITRQDQAISSLKNPTIFHA
jgi:tRNA-specific 2-thiouridylase